MLAYNFVQRTETPKTNLTKVCKAITKVSFVNNSNQFLAILCPIDRLIDKYLSERVQILNMLPIFTTSQLSSSGCAKIFSSLLNSTAIFNSRQRPVQFYVRLCTQPVVSDRPCTARRGVSMQKRWTLKDALSCTACDNNHLVDEKRKKALYLQYTELRIVTSSEKWRSWSNTSCQPSVKLLCWNIGWLMEATFSACRISPSNCPT